MTVATNENLIVVEGLKNNLGGTWVHDGIDLEIAKGDTVALIGPSGCGKTTLLRSIMMLRTPTEGTIKVFDIDTQQSTSAQRQSIRRRWGVMFQSAALFSAMTLYENILFPLMQSTDLPESECGDLVRMKLALVGLPQDAANKYPAEISGGMKKRAGVARAIALDPELLFFDEPTAGLDPQSASELDELMLHLKHNLGLTAVVVTHDLDTLWRVPDKVIFLQGGHVLAVKPMSELVNDPHPEIVAYFDNVRAQGHIKEGGG